MTDTTERMKGAGVITLEDGRELYSEYTMTYKTDVRQTAFGPIDFGSVIAGPTENFVKHPDGRIERCSMLAELMK